MTEDRPESPFTDDEYAFLRHVRFGELPPAARPEERVALTETEARRDRPEPADEDRWDLRHGA
ncbi:hypothetical protein GA0070606_6391 [Micromonospora citrea]|uniref:Uncharacterized protein n=1 Tax=Micromonospora citrea TaxID=47855 RepID=A0A1C6W3B4_9ACTN|nr:hypothetical protein [Micromonospora citrea]SCL72977.1 hypothetical protein GA0070606_6391 [Micromonospora citrea]